MKSGRPVLGIDTATARSSIALWDGEDVLALAEFHRRLSPSRCLMPAVEMLLQTAGLELTGLSCLAVTVGPGGFTGIRVGLATARALADAANLPLAGVSSLQAAAAAAAAGTGETVAVWLDAGRNEVYTGLFRDAAALTEERVLTPAAALEGLPAGPLCFVGDGACRYASAVAARPGAETADAVRPLPRGLAAATARLGQASLAAGRPLPPEPRYLRPPDATRARG